MSLLKLISVFSITMVLAACSKSGDSSANSASAAPVTSTLSVLPSPGTVAPSGTLNIYPSGGTSPYTFKVLNGGGSISQTSGLYTVYTAPAAAGLAQILVTDSANNIAYYSITIGTVTGGGGSAPTSCSGTYAVTVDGVTGTMKLVQDTSGYVGGWLLLNSAYSPISGNCSVTSKSISLVNWNTGVYYSGTFTISGSSMTVSGTLTNGSATRNWSGTYSSGLTTVTTTQSCEGTYTATINGQSATLYLFGDTGGNVAGALNLQNYNFTYAGTCVVNGTTGTVNMTNLTTGAVYSGTVAVGAHIVMQGSFTLSGGTYNWQATSQ